MQQYKTGEMSDARKSKIFGSMNGLYYLQNETAPEKRFIKIQEPERENQGKFQKILNQTMDQNFQSQIQISSLAAWGLLFLGILMNSLVPCWLMGDVKAESLTRNSWRHFIVGVLFLPFLLHEQRNLKDQQQKFLKVLTVEKLKPIFVSTVNFCIWLLCLMFACKHTSMNHAVCLTGLRIFLMSLLKIRNREKYHEFEMAGNFLCTLGVMLVLTDSIMLPQVLGPTAARYERTEPWKRLLLGDGLAIVGSVVSVLLDQNHSVPEMPRFTYLFLYKMFLTINLITAGYFFGGSEFSANVKFGIFGLYTYENFVSVFYVSVMLGLYLMVANILVAQIFDKVIINVASTFELPISTMLYHMMGLELIPSGMTCIGFVFLVPGLIFIIGGQGALEDSQNTINFQLYRPTEVRASNRITNFRSTLKNSLSLEAKKLGEMGQQVAKSFLSRKIKGSFEAISEEEAEEFSAKKIT